MLLCSWRQNYLVWGHMIGLAWKYGVFGTGYGILSLILTLDKYTLRSRIARIDFDILLLWKWLHFTCALSWCFVWRMKTQLSYTTKSTAIQDISKQLTWLASKLTLGTFYIIQSNLNTKGKSYSNDLPWVPTPARFRVCCCVTKWTTFGAVSQKLLGVIRSYLSEITSYIDTLI